MIAPDDEQFLARRGVPAGRIIMDAAVAHVYAIDEGITKRPAALDNTPAHGGHISHFISMCALCPHVRPASERARMVVEGAHGPDQQRQAGIRPRALQRCTALAIGIGTVQRVSREIAA
jgi:hypothetical protein